MTPEMMLAKMLSTESKMEEKTASVDDQDSLDDAKEKLAWAEELGRSLARRDFEKVAVTIPGAGQLMSSVQSGIGKAMHATMAAPAARRMAVGAAGGAAAGGLAGAVKNPGVDPATGQQRSRLGNIAAGMGVGAAGGAAAGYGAKRALQMVGGSKGAIGQATRDAMTAGGSTTKDMMRVKGLQHKANMVPKAAPAQVAGAAPAAPAAARPDIQPSLGKTLDQVRSGK